MLSRSYLNPRLALPVIAGAALSALPAAIRAQQHPANPAPAAQAAHAHPTAPAPADRAGELWATDPPLRDGMRRVRQAVRALEHYQHGHLDAVQTAHVASLIDGAVNGMIANCKLEPDADAALHGLLAKFLVGASAARSGQNVAVALADMQGALKQYPLLFDDPAWNASAD